MPNQLLLLAGANGFLAVAFGAFGAHGLEGILSADLSATFQTAVQYHIYHALALFGAGLLSLHYPERKLPKVSACFFMLGILLFSGSLYLLSLTGMGWLGAIAPLGGVCFLAGWGSLFWFAGTQPRQRQ